jgi:hypothetical protein
MTSIVTVDVDVYVSPDCGANVVGGGVNICTYTVLCGMEYTGIAPYNSFSSTSVAACIMACDNDNSCDGALFQISTQTCEFFSVIPSELTTNLVANQTLLWQPGIALLLVLALLSRWKMGIVKGI